MRLWRDYRFEAAHRLPYVPEGHKCGRMHGHSYRLRVTVDGPVQPNGMVVDFADIDSVVAPLVAQLDHHTLNDILENPTSEELARWLWAELVSGDELALAGVEISETERSGCLFTGGPVLCPVCGGSGESECGTRDTPCDNSPCHGHREEPCNTCTGEGMVSA